ncbi:MAG: SUMF1/EgtB/PvdO family nonheme iron enzyme [Polyangiaceae bacterium]
MSAQRDIDRRVDGHLADARSALAAAGDAEKARTEASAAAFAAFDDRKLGEGESRWEAALAASTNARRALREAGRQLEAGLAQDPARDDVRALLGQTLFDRAVLAESAHHDAERDELVDRFALYDAGGKLEARWRAPATLRISSSRTGVRVRLERWSPEARRWQPAQEVGELPAQVSIEPGSYAAVLGGEGLLETRATLVLARGAKADLDVTPPRLAGVPEGFAYVPAGTFVFGSADDEQTRRGWFDTVPAHPVRTNAFLIGRDEVTWGEWLAFLEALPDAERTRRTPRGGAPAGDSGHLALERIGGAWRLTMQPAGRAFVATAGQPLDYGHPGQATVRWERLPVTGISAEDARAYTAWLDGTRRVPGARLCSELVERAARGADGRTSPVALCCRRAMRTSTRRTARRAWDRTRWAATAPRTAHSA